MNALPSHRRTSLRTTLARRLGGNLALVAVLLAAWIANVAGATSAEGRPFSDTGLDRVQQLVEKHHCWTGKAPPDIGEPKHAVVTLPGGRARVMSADVGYGIWLYHEPGVLHAFCA